MKVRKLGITLLLLAFCLLPAVRTEAAPKNPKSIKLNKKTVSELPGKSIRLKATITPKGAGGGTEVEQQR